MKFGPVPLSEAEGAVLAHSLQLHHASGEAEGSYRIAKGTQLQACHIADLAASGVQEVTVARLEPGDLGEDPAALHLAQALVPDAAGQNIRLSNAGAGRVNLYARSCGIIRLDRDRIETLNGVDPMITLATVPPFHRVDAGSMIATIKIISYAVAEDLMRAAVKGIAGAIKVLPPVFAHATLIETQVSDMLPSDKGRRAMAGRLHRMGVDLSPRQLVAHREQELAQALRRAPGELLLILTGSATSDVRDVAPQALRMAGGEVTRFGMPVDPGNLLFLGRLGEKPVIGLPGCARSPALNGADWVLERVLCGLDVSARDIAAMGVGGLLKEIPTRPMPREA